MTSTKQVIIYGAGDAGRSLYDFLDKLGYLNSVYCYCDKNAESIKQIGKKEVYTLEDLADMDIPYFISVKDPTIYKEIEDALLAANKAIVKVLPYALGIDNIEYNRAYCAFYHIESMDDYFDMAEKGNNLEYFWSGIGPFYDIFRKLDLDNVIELACGRGRHIQKYIEKANHVTVVDILEKNIEFCRERYSSYDNITYYCNNGFNLEKLESDQYSALFSYDAMVHFELIDIYSYLKDIYRVLKANGRVLIHHSNNHADYRASFLNGTQGRSFMSKDIFANLADRIGFEVLEQHVIDWGKDKELDCITLLEKNYSHLPQINY